VVISVASRWLYQELASMVEWGRANGPVPGFAFVYGSGPPTGHRRASRGVHVGTGKVQAAKARGESHLDAILLAELRVTADNP